VGRLVKQLEENILRQSVVYKEVNRSIVLRRRPDRRFLQEEPGQVRHPRRIQAPGDLFLHDRRFGGRPRGQEEGIDDKLKAGADFAELSGAESDVPMKESKGDLGTMKRPEMDKTLLRRGEAEEGEISPWVTAKNGLYLLKLEDKKDSRQLAFDEARKQIEDRLFAEKQNAKLTEFLTKIKKQSYIKILKANPIGN